MIPTKNGGEIWSADEILHQMHSLVNMIEMLIEHNKTEEMNRLFKWANEQIKIAMLYGTVREENIWITMKELIQEIKGRQA